MIWGVLNDLHLFFSAATQAFVSKDSQHGKKRSLCVGWTRNTDWEVTEIQRTAEDVSCHYLYLRRTQPQPQTVFAQIQNTDLPAQFIVFFWINDSTPSCQISPQLTVFTDAEIYPWAPLSFFVSFPIPSPNLGVLWLLAHLGESLSIICHHQCSRGQTSAVPCNYIAQRSASYDT